MASVIGMSTRIRMAVWVRALRLRGAFPTLLLLFAYASVEQSTMLWASSYMVHAVAPVMLGFGCAPINPAVVHMTPRLFGAVHTMTMIGWETAVIAVATLVSPVLFAVFSATVGMAALPWYLACFTSLGILAAVILMSVSHLQSRAR